MKIVALFLYGKIRIIVLWPNLVFFGIQEGIGLKLFLPSSCRLGRVLSHLLCSQDKTCGCEERFLGVIETQISLMSLPLKSFGHFLRIWWCNYLFLRCWQCLLLGIGLIQEFSTFFSWLVRLWNKPNFFENSFTKRIIKRLFIYLTVKCRS